MAKATYTYLVTVYNPPRIHADTFLADYLAVMAVENRNGRPSLACLWRESIEDSASPFCTATGNPS